MTDAAAMLSEGRDVFMRVLYMAGVALVGWILRRRDLLKADATRVVSRVAIDICLPALTFTQMLKTVKPDLLTAHGLVLLMGLLILAVCVVLAYVVARIWLPAAQRVTFTFLVGMPNWIFLPLPIAQALFKDAGVQTVLLVNIPGQLVLWTCYVAMLRGGVRGAAAWRGLVANPGLNATLGGIAVALWWPASSAWATSSGVMGSLIQALELAGSLTIPLSLLITGAQLAGIASQQTTAKGPIWAAIAGRLLVAPIVTIPLIRWFATPLGNPVVRTLELIAMMPVAVTCALFVERFGGDLPLTTRAIGYSTVAAVITVPLLFALL